MKPIYFISVVSILLMTTMSYGQLSGKGVKGGVSFANVGGDDAKNPEPQSFVTFNAGVFATFEMSSTLSLQPEILYSVKGFKIEQTLSLFGQNVDLSATGKISYLEIPVLIKFGAAASSEKAFRPCLFFGPEIAFKLNGTMKSEITGQPSQEQDFTNLNSTDYGVIVGIGADITVSNLAVVFDVRYDLGLRTINSSQNPVDIQNRVISINGGFKF